MYDVSMPNEKTNNEGFHGIIGIVGEDIFPADYYETEVEVCSYRDPDYLNSSMIEIVVNLEANSPSEARALAKPIAQKHYSDLLLGNTTPLLRG